MGISRCVSAEEGKQIDAGERRVLSWWLELTIDMHVVLYLYTRWQCVMIGKHPSLCC